MTKDCEINLNIFFPISLTDGLLYVIIILS